MEKFYINRIFLKKKRNPRVYEDTIIELFDEPLDWGEVEQLENKYLSKLMTTLEKNISIYESPYDLEKLASVIQYSRSGVGLSAMTMYQCKFCEKDEMWGNTATPNICKECARKMAKNIIERGYDIAKNKE